MKREFTCIICPNGCEISGEIENGAILSMEGALCPKGTDYVQQELTDPQRNIATSILVRGGVLPLASVRLTNAIPKKEVFRAMEAIKKITLDAPVHAGDVVIHSLLGYDSAVIVTKTVEVAE